MNNQITIISGMLSVTLLLTIIMAEFMTLAAPNAFGQQAVFDNIDKGNRGLALDTTENNHSTNSNNVTDHNIVAISTTTSTNDSTSVPSGNVTQIIPIITVRDVINSTYTAPRDADEDESARRLGRAVRDRIVDIFHTVVATNATIIISSATITNAFVNESITINNYTRLREIIPDQVEAAMVGIRAMSQPAKPLLELHTDIETMCTANNISFANCDMNIKIR